MDKRWMIAGGAAFLILLGGYYMTTAKGLRNNNPLNIKKSTDNWVGQTGDDGTFVIFDTVKHGFRAAGRVLRTYATRHELSTIAGIISRWAPTNENDTSNYINFVSSKTGIGEHELLTREQYPIVLGAMVHMENGSNPFSLAEIKEGFEWGFYG